MACREVAGEGGEEGATWNTGHMGRVERGRRWDRSCALYIFTRHSLISLFLFFFLFFLLLSVATCFVVLLMALSQHKQTVLHSFLHFTRAHTAAYVCVYLLARRGPHDSRLHRATAHVTCWTQIITALFSCAPARSLKQLMRRWHKSSCSSCISCS
jgi:hypothetical protein